MMVFSSRLIKLSPLETEILKLFSERQWMGSKETYSSLKQQKAIAATSVSVLLDRLYKKGLLQRREETCRGGTRFVYRHKKDKEMYERNAIETTVNLMIKKFGNNALNYFNERFGKEEKQ